MTSRILLLTDARGKRARPWRPPRTPRRRSDLVRVELHRVHVALDARRRRLLDELLAAEAVEVRA